MDHHLREYTCQKTDCLMVFWPAEFSVHLVSSLCSTRHCHELCERNFCSAFFDHHFWYANAVGVCFSDRDVNLEGISVMSYDDFISVSPSRKLKGSLTVTSSYLQSIYRMSKSE